MKTIDKSPALVCLPLLLAVHGFMTLACAQDTTSPPASGPLVSPEFCPAMNQQTNPAVTARLVKLAAQGSSSRPCLVLFNSQSKQVLVGCATNRTCLLNGSFFQVDPGQQGFFVTMSRPLGADQLTEQKAIELSRQAFQAEPSSRLHLEPGTEYIDLRELLKQERELGLANPLILSQVNVNAEGSNLLVNFVSATGLQGTVTLDRQLNVLSTALSGSKK